MSAKKNKVNIFDEMASFAEEEHDKKVARVLGEPSKEERATSLISMTKAEKQRLTELSRAHGLSLSAFVRLATDEYISNHGW